MNILLVNNKKIVTIYENYIEIDTLFGDVDYSGVLDIDDAFMVFENTVNLIEFDSLTQAVGDVTLNGNISNLDASFIMQYIFGFLSVV